VDHSQGRNDASKVKKKSDGLSRKRGEHGATERESEEQNENSASRYCRFGLRRACRGDEWRERRVDGKWLMEDGRWAKTERLKWANSGWKMADGGWGKLTH
jgi:Ni/Co efflux regulator RcnB